MLFNEDLTVEAELLKVTGHGPQAEGETRYEFLIRMVRAATTCSNKKWSSLSTEAQEWVVNAGVAVNETPLDADVPITDFPDSKKYEAPLRLSNGHAFPKKKVEAFINGIPAGVSATDVYLRLRLLFPNAYSTEIYQAITEAGYSGLSLQAAQAASSKVLKIRQLMRELNVTP